MYYAEDFNPRARAAIDWTKAELNSKDHPRQENLKLWAYIGEMKETHRENGMLLAHGSPRDPVREYLLPRDAADTRKMSECFARMADPVCFVGHSHVPGIYLEGGGFMSPPEIGSTFQLPGWNGSGGADKKAIVNIGSVGQPRDGDTRSSYCLFDNGKVTFRRLEYDYRKTMAKIRAIPDLPEFLAERLAVGR
jgi:diadenosine tetraphosphatase ApaH/serine/threonine PP2A family protein phosphatase